MAGRVTDVGFLQRARTHDHGFARLARPGGLEAYRCSSRSSVCGEVPEGRCNSELGRVYRRSSVFFVSLRLPLCVVKSAQIAIELKSAVHMPESEGTANRGSLYAT